MAVVGDVTCFGVTSGDACSVDLLDRCMGMYLTMCALVRVMAGLSAVAATTAGNVHTPVRFRVVLRLLVFRVELFPAVLLCACDLFGDGRDGNGSITIIEDAFMWTRGPLEVLLHLLTTWWTLALQPLSNFSSANSLVSWGPSGRSTLPSRLPTLTLLTSLFSDMTLMWSGKTPIRAGLGNVQL